MMKIGVIPDSFEVPFKEAVILARDLGAKGLQPYVTGGEMAPENLDKDARKALLQFVRDNGLCFSALCADFGLNFKDPDNEAGVQRTMRMMELALDFDTHIITTHIGKVPEDENCRDYANMLKTIERLGKYGDTIGVMFATETGPEPAPKLKAILDRADTKSAKVNFDPANLVMCSHDIAADDVYVLRDYIVHTHAKDGVYTGETTYEEKILGAGGVNYGPYLAALKDIGYDGFLTIEREAGATRFEDIRHAVNFLTDHLAKLY